MISLSGKAKVLEKLAIDKSPVLLTAIGVAGVIGTAVLTHRAATKAERQGVEVVTGNHRKDKFQQHWKYYIPPVVSGGMTIGAIIMANRIGTKRAAALAAAYTILEKSSEEYRQKVIEKMGEKEEQKVRTEIAQDRLHKMPPNENTVLMVAGGDHLFAELYTGRYFRSDIETIKKAVNETNYRINTHGYASLSDFYDTVGLPHTVMSDEMGWTSDKLMDVDYHAILSEDGQPCIAINYTVDPVRNYARFH